MKTIKDIYESVDLRLVEAKTKKPGVLAVVEGTFFVANKPSRNNRMYPVELWENVLKSPDVRRLLENRLMFGTVGHEDIDFDALIREQKVSHVVTELRITEDGRGVGKAEILDTPVGRILKTLLESGSRLAVSSKGYGEYKESLSDGVWVVDPESFVLERFDFVVDPGFLEAQPRLKEVYESVVVGRKEDKLEDVEIVEKLLREKQELERKLVSLTESVIELEKRLKEAEEKVIQKSEDRKVREGREMEETKVREQVDRDNEVFQRILAREIEKLGDLVVEKLKVSEEDISASSLVGVLRKIRKVLSEGLGGDRKDVREDFYRRRIKQLIEKLREKDEVLKKASVVLRKVEKLGGVEAIEKALNESYKVMVAIGNQLLKENAERLSVEGGISRKEVVKLIKKHGLKEAKEIVRKMRGERLVERVEREVVAVEDRGERKILAEKIAERQEEMIKKKVNEDVEKIYKVR